MVTYFYLDFHADEVTLCNWLAVTGLTETFFDKGSH